MASKTAILDSHEFKPLTRELQQEKTKIKTAYSDFWNSIQFRKGWSNPPFQQSEVEPYLDSAAEVVARIRHELDHDDPQFKLRMIDGSAREYLWSLETKPKHPRRFIKALVKATFRDAHGYIEGLKGTDIDKFLEKFWEYQQSVEQSKKNDVRGNFKRSWDTTCDILKELLGSGLFQSESKDLSDENTSLIQNMMKGMHHLQLRAEQLLIKQNRMEEEQQSSGVATPIEDETISEVSQEEKMETEEPKQTVPPVQQEEQQQTQETSEQKPINDEEKDVPPPTPKTDESLVKIKVVTEDVANLKTRIQDLTENANKLEYSQLSTVEGGEKIVEDLQRKCLAYTEGLMTDLLKLDSITSSPESRILRKEQVKNIQSMLDEVDLIKSKLHDMSKQLKEERKKKELEEQAKKEEEKKEEQSIPPPSSPQQTVPTPSSPQLPTPTPSSPEEEESKAQQTEDLKRQIYLQTRESRLKDKWQQLKLEPNFQVNEGKDAYVIQGYIPGMNEEDIKLKFSRDRHSLTVEGVRVPSPTEEDLLRQQLRRQIKQDPFLRTKINQLSQEDEDMLALRSGLGRFGRFSETYQLPSSINVDAIEAVYDKGILKVVLPKFQVRPHFRQQNRFGSPFGNFSPSGHFQDPFVLDDSNWW